MNLARRGMAMPLVIVLTVVGVVLVAGVLERHGAQSLLARRQLESYRAHHAGQGLRELIDMWLGGARGRQLSQRLGTDGTAMEIALPAGTIPGRDALLARVRFMDAQGSILADMTGLTARGVEDIKLLREALASQAAPADNTAAAIPAARTRTQGPVAVSLFGADDAVLGAVAQTVAGPEGALALLEVLKEARSDPSTRSIGAVASRAGLVSEKSAMLRRLLTTTPTLWRCRVELRQAQTPGAAPIETYEGMAYLGGGAREAGSAGGGGPQPRGGLVGLEVVRPTGEYNKE